MSAAADRIAQLEAAIAAQDELRATLGDETVDTAVAALRRQLEALRAEAPADPRKRAQGDGNRRGGSRRDGGSDGGDTLALLQARIPAELADKVRLTGAARVIVGERRSVTVLFADLSGFTTLSERFDPELIRAFQDDLFGEMASVVYEYEGFVEKFVGDAILAVFGAPVSHEDDAERALRAALAIRERVHGLSERWVDRLGEPLTLHIGVNSGTVVAGQMGSGEGGAYAVTGDTITTASRLQGAAQPGQILVGERTQRLAHEAFTFRRVEALELRGKRERMTVFELQRAKLHPGKSRGLSGLSSPIVGRQDELAQLGAVGDSLLAGRGQVVMVVGEAGIGKSRLMAEWQASLGKRVRWLEGRSFAHTSESPYGPFLDLCRRYAGITDEDSEAQARDRLRAVLERVLPADMEAQAIVAGMLGMRAEPEDTQLLGGLAPEALEQRLFAMIERFFERLARQRPTVLIMEDLHWADSSSVELLERLLPLTTRRPLVVVGVSRAGPNQHPISPALLEDYGDRLTNVELAALGEAATVDLVQRLLSSPELAPIARALIVGKAEGNPFYVEEVVRSLIERGALVRAEQGSRWVTTPLIETVTVPDTLQGVLMARLDRLPDETKRVAQQASVIGRMFPFRVLQELDVGMGGLAADLEHLVREELIREIRQEPDLEYVFEHALTQEVAYESLLAVDRRELHARVGEAMERLSHGRLGEYLGILGGHFLRGEKWEKAFRYLRRAGDAATRLHAHPEARSHYERALQALTQLPESDGTRRQIVNMTIKLVTVSWGADDPEHNLARLAYAAALAETPRSSGRSRSADRARLARVHYWMGVIHYLRDEPIEAIAYFQQVLAVAQDLGDEELLAMPSALIGRAMVMQGHFGQAAALLEQALAPLERAEDWLEWAYTLAFLGAAHAVRGQVTFGRAETERALARAREKDNPTAIAGCLLALSFHPLLARDAAALRDAGRVAAEAGEAAGSPLLLHLSICFESWGLSKLGEHEAARRRMADAQAVGETLGGRLFMADWVAGVNAELALNAGQPEEAIPRAVRAVEMAQAVGGIYGEALARRIWAEALARIEPVQDGQVDAQLARSVELFEAGECLMEAAHTRLLWGTICRQRGDVAAADEHMKRAVEVFESGGLERQLEEARAALALPA